MSGDLGNLLTGELGEAEARFSHEDFAALYGRRIAGRVRRRRAVRAAGVGGGTMLTAGALVVGVTQVPWGTLGATPGVGVGATDCVTPSPSSHDFSYTVTDGAIQDASAQLVVTDVAAGGVLYRGWVQADGTWVFRDADGNPVDARQEPDGSYVVNVDGATVDFNPPGTDPSAAASDQTPTATFTYTVGASEGSSSPSGSDDCLTPSPTPTGDATASPDPSSSPDPSLAAKPEELDGSPYQCGFVFPTESRETDEITFMTPKWLDPADALLQMPEVPLGSPPLPAEGELGPVAEVTIAMRVGPREVNGGSGWLWTSTDPTDPALLQIQLGAFDNSTMRKVFKSVGFVGVQHGTVVAVPFASADLVDGGWKTSETAVSVAVETDGDSEYPQVFLVDKNSLLEPCPGVTTPVADMDVTAVAGMVVLQPGESTGDTSYGWWPLGTP